MYKRIVIKIGTSSLTHSTGMINIKSITDLVRVVADIHNMGTEIIIVTSGAVGVGLPRLGFTAGNLTMQEKQAAAAIGQSELMNIYAENFRHYGKTVAQLLLTRDAIDQQKLRQNAHNTFSTLLSHNVIPIVNENDTIAVEELGVSDNDTLSAYVAQIVDAELLILLTDIDGLYDRDPREHHDAVLIQEVREITDEIRCAAGTEGSAHGTGGMVTKLVAAEIAMNAGIDMIIAKSDPDILYDIVASKQIGTRFIGR